MSKKIVSALDRIKAENPDLVTEPYQLTDEIVLDPISLKAVELLEESGLDGANPDDVLPILKVVFGAKYDEAMLAVPLSLAAEVMKDVLTHMLPPEVAEKFLATVNE